MTIADRYNASDAIVDYLKYKRGDIWAELARSSRSNAMDHIASVSNTI